MTFQYSVCSVVTARVNRTRSAPRTATPPTTILYRPHHSRYSLTRTTDAGYLIVIDIAGKPAAAAFLLGSGQSMEIPWASSLRKYNSIGVNMLLYWEALQVAIAGNYKQFDFGRSTMDSGTYRFKRQWGAKPRQLYWHYWLRSGNGAPKLNPDNPKYRFAIAVWRRMPVLFANFLGPRIVRYLP